MPMGNGMSRISIFGLVLLSSALVANAVLNLPAVIVLRSHTITWESIHADNKAEPNESLTYSIMLQNSGGAAALNVVATLVNANGITPITTDQNYGDMAPNSSPVSRDFTFTVAGPAGRAAQARLILTSGASVIGNVVFDVPVGDMASTYENWITIRVPGATNVTQGPADVYPASIHVSGLPGLILSTRVTLHNYTHEFARDVNALLVSPAGSNVMLMSDCGGATYHTNVNLTFDSGITNALSGNTMLVSGTYSATDHSGGNVMAAPAPTSPPFGTYLSQLKRTNPNGEWKLYLYDWLGADIGIAQGGWSLSLVILGPPTMTAIDNGDGRVRLTISSMGQRSFLIDASTNLTDWTVLGQVSGLTDPATFFDDHTNRVRRFYRARRNTP
jgi:uncharacterized repeat protein (TIGR01451 family)